MRLQTHFPRALGLSALVVLGLSACGSDNTKPTGATVDTPEPVQYRYQVTLTNLTQAQPLSPIAGVLHQQGQFWRIGEPASGALEALAEGGDNSALLAKTEVIAHYGGEASISPGHTDEFTLSVEDVADSKLTLATMLVNTNDAFTGVNAVDLTPLAAGQSISLYGHGYDAGTEGNSELAQFIPGPAGMGEGFNAIRDDTNFVALHPGVVSADDGLAQSALGAQHRFDNPVIKVVITRTE